MPTCPSSAPTAASSADTAHAPEPQVTTKKGPASDCWHGLLSCRAMRLLRAGSRCRSRSRCRCCSARRGLGGVHRISTVLFTAHVGLVARRDDHVHRQSSKQDETNNNLPHINISWDGFVQSRGLARDAVHDSSRRVHLRAQAACRVANTRNSYGYCCVLRLAAHPDPQSTLAARFVQRIPRADFHTQTGSKACSPQPVNAVATTTAQGGTRHRSSAASATSARATSAALCSALVATG